ncbi:hypothetical protein L3N51_02278 [Metallosphaera sp. J1]|uniref:hypothetical protein n=1 Tax=Metallosphaera javensis (ex Sakai et al. 2022) TaxID=2775498 RepID=UPI0025826A08|nr:hypothetical protein [Metallosphaera javensis (ex Hofmann et al. 2022)]BCS93740.1 MAG: hypothetical protein MjAS7_2348 [Metallosphaera javensis (ex Sakai et al. 2022)]
MKILEGKGDTLYRMKVHDFPEFQNILVEADNSSYIIKNYTNSGYTGDSGFHWELNSSFFISHFNVGLIEQ